MEKKQSAYAAAGVDIDEMDRGLDSVRKMIKSTFIDGVLSDIGSFGGLFASPGKDHALVASTDSVGTKLKVAVMANRHDTIGQDIVNHCVNDILVQGAHPLFFLDYLGISRLQAPLFKQIVKGLCKACRENGCALLGGETAELPGLYPEKEYDLVGTVVGAVSKKRIITGGTIREGDRIIGLPSNGLHTNGYSLARKVIFETAGLGVDDILPGTKKSVADALLAVHKSYLKPVARLQESLQIQGMAHITGGGLVDNLPRILPGGLQAVIDRGAWRTPPLFSFIEETGRVDHEEMYRVFNMGIGYTIVVREKDVETAEAVLKQQSARPVIIGSVQKGDHGVRFSD